jgi:hypothetical protein
VYLLFWLKGTLNSKYESDANESITLAPVHKDESEKLRHTVFAQQIYLHVKTFFLVILREQ